MYSRKFILVIVLFLFTFAILPVHSRAQSILGSILGAVTDTTGAVIPNATVKVTNTSTGVTNIVTTNSHGDYQLLNLVAGRYQVLVTSPGFQQSSMTDLVLSARQVLRANAELKPGAVNQEVHVNGGSAGVITTDTPSIDSELTAKDVLNLPANFRASTNGTSALYLIQAMPGVNTAKGDHFAVQGAGQDQAEFTVDGMTFRDANNGNIPFENALPSAETMTSIRVDGVINDAQYGAPGEVTFVTKSGTNHLHGALFWYNQQRAFNATPFGSLTNPAINTSDLGVTAGGPVYLPRIYNGHNRTFFYGTFEGYRSPRQETVQYRVPTAQMKQGNFSNVVGVQPLRDPFTGGTYPNYTVPINPVSQKFLQFFPDPNVGNTQLYSPGDTNYIANVGNSQNSNQFDIRIDQYIGHRALVFGRFTWEHEAEDIPFELLAVDEGIDYDYDKNIIGVFNYTFSPNVENVFRYGFTEHLAGQNNSFDGKSFTESTGLTPLQDLWFNAMPEISFDSNMTSLSSTRLTYNYVSRMSNYSDDLNWTRGSHTMQFGVGFLDIKDVTPEDGSYQYGDFSFSNASMTGQEFADFLIGTPDETSYSVVPADNQGLAWWFSAYAQDHWLVTPRLTLNYGIRWEYQPAYYSPVGEVGNFDPSVPLSGELIYQDGYASQLSLPYLDSVDACGIGQTSGTPAQNGAPCTPVLSNSQAGLPAGLYSAYPWRFFPRFGFAFRPFNNDKTSVLGGFGIYNNPLNGSIFADLNYSLQSNAETFSNAVTSTGPTYVWPDIFGGTGKSSNAGAIGTRSFSTGVEPDWKQPYTEQFALSIEHDLGGGFGGRISYIGDMSHHLVWKPKPNLLPFSSTTSAYGQPLSARPFPNWGNINMAETGADANYQSMQLALWKHTSQISVDSTYTLAKSLSDNQGIGQGADFPSGQGAGSGSWLVPRYDFGQVSGQPRNRWLTSMVYSLPFGRGQRFGGGMNRVANEIVGGWNISNILLWQSGLWLQPAFSGGQADPSGTGSSLASGLFGEDFADNGTVADWGTVSVIPHHRSPADFLQKGSAVCPGDPSWEPGTECHTGDGQEHEVNGVMTPDPPPIGRFGDLQAGSVEAPGMFNLSTGLAKSFRLTEGMTLRMEGSFTNVLNHPNYNNPQTNPSSTSYGVITQAIENDFGGARNGQVSVRLEF